MTDQLLAAYSIGSTIAMVFLYLFYRWANQDTAGALSAKDYFCKLWCKATNERDAWQAEHFKALEEIRELKTPRHGCEIARPVSFLIVDYNGQVLRVAARSTAEKLVEHIRMSYLADNRLECPPVDVLEVTGPEQAIESLFGLVRG